MNNPPTVFSQLMQWIHPQRFQRCVERYRGMYKVQDFSCWDQFLCMSFAQLTYRESLRDIEACLRSRGSQLYHMGIRGHVARMNLARANAQRDWRKMPVASGAFLQVDQATSANPSLLRNFAQCRENPNLDCHLRLRAGGDHPQGTPPVPELAQHFAGLLPNLWVKNGPPTALQVSRHPEALRARDVTPLAEALHA